MILLQVSEVIEANSIKFNTIACSCTGAKGEGKCDLAEFIMNRQLKVIVHVMKTTWDMINAKATLDRSNKARIQLLEEAAAGECVGECRGRWLQCVEEVFRNNNISPTSNNISLTYFANAAYTVSEKGRGKYRNIMLVALLAAKHFC